MTTTTSDSAAPPNGRSLVIAGIVTLAIAAVGAGLDVQFGWLAHVHQFIAHQFYEVPQLAKLRAPSQLALLRVHLAIWMGLLGIGLIAASRINHHGRMWLAIFLVGYAIRATAWIIGGNLPMVSGDSPHYVEIASSILKGEGPVKHYVESFFRDYPAIRENKGVLDDWATPLYGYVLALSYRVLGVVPGESLEATVAVDKLVSFKLNLLCLPLIYLFARRRFNHDIALGAMALLAILPVHAIYAGLDLRESLVAFTSLLAVWLTTEIWATRGKAVWGWVIAAGIACGAAILARNTAIAIVATLGIHGLIWHRKSIAPMIAWGIVTIAVITPWAIATQRVYGEPFYTYTKYFQYTFSWTVHHYQEGIPRASDFYNATNAASIARVKMKSLLIVIGYSTMIMSLPLVLAFFRRLREKPRNDTDKLVALLLAVFVAATLANIADVTQVAQLGRYYLPIFVVMLPTAACGLADWWRRWSLPSGCRPMFATVLIALLWADPTWAYDATWFTKPYQLHWPALRAAGDFAKAHPELVPADARIMTWFPWEFRLASDRTTILMPRNFDPRRMEAVMRQYGVTHVLWGSFETPQNIDVERFGPFLTSSRVSLGLSDSRAIFTSPPDQPFGVTLYRLRGANP